MSQRKSCSSVQLSQIDDLWISISIRKEHPSLPIVRVEVLNVGNICTMRWKHKELDKLHNKVHWRFYDIVGRNSHKPRDDRESPKYWSSSSCGFYQTVDWCRKRYWTGRWTWAWNVRSAVINFPNDSLMTRKIPQLASRIWVNVDI